MSDTAVVPKWPEFEAVWLDDFAVLAESDPTAISPGMHGRAGYYFVTDDGGQMPLRCVMPVDETLADDSNAREQGGPIWEQAVDLFRDAIRDYQESEAK